MSDNVLTFAMIKESVEKLKNTYQLIEPNYYLLSPEEWNKWKEAGLI